MRRILAASLCTLALAACHKDSAKSGAVVAAGKGFDITSGEFKARLEEQPPFMRGRYNTLERRKEFLDILVQNEVLAAEARRQGLDKDADVQMALKKVMIQKLVQRVLADPKDGSSASDADAQKYFDEHRPEFYHPRRVRLAAVSFASDAGSPKRAKDLAQARKALAKLKADEKKNPLAFNAVVTEFSEDNANKASGGDLGFKTEEELAKAFSPEFAQATLALKQGETSGVLESPKGVHIVKFLGQQEEVNRTFDQVKPQIVNRLTREKRQKDFQDWVKKLKDDAGVKVDEKALEAVEIAGAAGPTPGMPGMPGMGAPGSPISSMPPGHPPMPAPAPGSVPAAPPSSTPAPPPAPAAAK